MTFVDRGAETIALDRIYDAAFDDGALGSLTRDLAAGFGARSSLIHWVHSDGRTAVMADSGYFSPEQLTTYAAQYAAIDPWMAASNRPGTANRVDLLEKIIPAAAFRLTPFYKEYIAAMGDDTCRLMGVRLESRWGTGFIGLQRGAGHSEFQQAEVDRFATYAPHLLRMLSTRGRIGQAERCGQDLAGALDARGEAMWVLDADGRVLECNRAAETMLSLGDALVTTRGHLIAVSGSARARLIDAIECAAKGMGTTAVAIPTGSGGSVELTLSGFADRDCGRRVLAIAPAPACHDSALPSRLRALHDLSKAEAQIAIALADGLSLLAIARRRGSAPATVRHQVKTIAAKMGCNRQVEIVAAVLRLPRLH